MADFQSPIGPLTEEDWKVYNDNKHNIDKKLRETFSWIPADFQLKPVRTYHIEACGRIYKFNVALPDNKYARVTFLVGGFYVGPPSVGGAPPKRPEPTIQVEEKLLSSPDEV